MIRSRALFQDENQFQLMRKKGVFCYEYATDIKTLDEAQLPPRESFSSILKGEAMSNAEYEHAQKVWETFKCRTLGEYSDIYLQTDVILLADIFEYWRNVYMSTYHMDCAHAFTAPSMSWEALLRTSTAQIQLISDHDQLLFVERCIRGGITHCSKRFAGANNTYLETYDKDKELSTLIYYDCNNLYAYAMMQCLQIREFSWFSAPEGWDAKTIADNDEYGYMLEVDLEYPCEFHDKHNDYPLCSEHINLGVY